MKKLLILVASLVVMWANSASAAIIVTLDSIGQDLSNPSLFDWVYRAELQPTQSMMDGRDFFTVYDFPNILNAQFNLSPDPLVTGHTFTLSQAATGLTSSLVAPPDSAAIGNVSVSLTGGGDITPTGHAVTLGNLIVQTTTRATVEGWFSGQGQLTANNSKAGNSGNVLVQAAIPEPATLTLTLVGLIAVGVLAIRRRLLG